MVLRNPEYKAELEARGAQWLEWRGAEVVGSFGDVEGEYDAVRGGGVGLVDRSERETLVLTGEDTIPWLQSLLTNDLLALEEEGSGQWSCAVGTTGRLIADMRLLHVPEMLIADLEVGVLDEALMGHLRRHIITEKVRLMNRSAQTARLGLYGQGAADVLHRAGRFVRDLGGLSEFHGSWGEVAGADVIVQRISLGELAGFEISCGVDEVLAVWRALEKAGGDAVRPIGHEALEWLRIEAGVPRFGVELHDKVIPLEAGLYETISFTKGCYLGQEIIARLDTLGTPARVLRKVVLESDAVPAVGESVKVEGKEVGQVLSAIYSKVLDKPIALAYIKRGHNDPGASVEIQEVLGKVVALDASFKKF